MATVLLKISAYYPDFIKTVYHKDQGLALLPFEEQMTALFSRCFAMADFWKQILEKTNKFHVMEIVTNAEIAQKKWASENKIEYSETDWRDDILESQIEFYRPEVVFFQDYAKAPMYYKEKYKFIKYIISWDGLALQNLELFRGADLVATCHKYSADHYLKKGMPSYHFLFGFYPSILNRISSGSLSYDISFVGSVNSGKRAHNDRIQLLRYLSDNFNVDFWLSGIGNTNLFSRAQIKKLVTGKVGQILDLNRIIKKNKGEAFGLDMLQILASSRITFNSHIDAAGDIAGNLRLFEATGIGTCLLTDWKVNLHEMFEIDSEVVAYKSIPECIEKAKWLLENEGKRKEIAAAGQSRTLKDYSMESMVHGLMRYAQLM